MNMGPTIGDRIASKGAGLPLLAALLVAIAAFLGWNLWNIDRLPFDSHNYRQSQTLATIEFFVRDGVDWFYPRTNYVGEQGVFVLEFPLYQALASHILSLSGGSLPAARWLNLVIFLLSGWVLFLIGRTLLGAAGGLVTLCAFFSSRLNISYGTSFLIDPLAVLFLLLSIWSAIRFFGISQGIAHRASMARQNSGLQMFEHGRGKPLWGALVLVSALGCALIKPPYLFPLLAFLLVAGIRQGVRSLSTWKMWVICGLVLLPAAVTLAFWLRHSETALATNEYYTTLMRRNAMIAGLDPDAPRGVLILLGFDALADWTWYRLMIGRAILRFVGPGFGILCLAGWIWGFVVTLRERAITRSAVPCFTLLSVFGFWMLFADIVRPHDYYSLPAVAFLSLGAGFGALRLGEWLRNIALQHAKSLVSVAVLISVLLALFVPSSFTRSLQPNHHAANIHKLGAGILPNDTVGILFIHADFSTGGSGDSPPGLWSLGMRGTGWMVQDEQDAAKKWNLIRPLYHRLDAVCFYGLEPLAEVKEEFPHVLFQKEGLTILQRVP